MAEEAGTFFLILASCLHLSEISISLSLQMIPGSQSQIFPACSPDSPSTLVPGGLCHSPPKQTGPSSCGEREGERERRKLSPPTTGRGQRGQASLCPPPLGDPCTPGTLLLQGLARFVNIQLWEEAGLIWWEEGDKEGLVWWNKEGG